MIIKQKANEPVDINQIYQTLKFDNPQFSDIYMYQFEDQVFFYHPIGRKAYRILVELDENPLVKEELVCKECVIWPKDFDFEECEAGLPTELSKVILDNSFVNSKEDRQQIINHFRQEMYDMDNQVTCMIHEAYNEYSLEEIEEWDMLKTAKYASRAEWILVNFRGAQYHFDPFTGATPEELEAQAKQQQTNDQDQSKETVTYSQNDIDEYEKEQAIYRERIKNGQLETVEERQARLKNKMGKEKLSPKKLAELKAKYPEMHFDNLVTDESQMHENIDTLPPALRTR